MNIQHLRKVAGYLISFGVGRGALFGAPFLLANFLPAVIYGEVEIALAAASLLAGLAALGTAGATPLVILRHNSRATLKGIVTHHLIVVTTIAAIVLIGLVLQRSQLWLLTALLTSGLMMQSLASTHLKVMGHGDASVLIDAGLLGLITLAVYLANFNGSVAPLRWVWAGALLYSAILVAVYARLILHPDRSAEPTAWCSTLYLSIPLMLGGLVSLLATTSGRLGMGMMAGPALTAEYALLARAGALPIVAHQLILISKYRDLFTQSDEAVERTTLHIVLLVGASILVFGALSPWLGYVLGSAFETAHSQHKRATYWILTQAVLWSAIALNELICTRHQIVSKVLPRSASFLFIALTAGWGALSVLEFSLEKFVLIHSAVMFFFYIFQSWTMHRLRVPLQLTWVNTTLIYAGLMAVGSWSD